MPVCLFACGPGDRRGQQDTRGSLGAPFIKAPFLFCYSTPIAGGVNLLDVRLRKTIMTKWLNIF